MLPPQMRDPIAPMPGLGNPDRGDPLAGANDPTEERAAFFAEHRPAESTCARSTTRPIANNVAIYAVDPRGLADLEFDIEREHRSAGPIAQYLSATMDTLRTLAEKPTAAPSSTATI